MAAKAIHIRFNRSDYDLILLSTQNKMSQIMRTAIRNHLSGNYRRAIPLPDYVQQPQTYKMVNVRLDDDKDADIIEFIESIPKGNKNHVYKLLLRYSMEGPDIRQWMNDPEAAKKPKAAISKSDMENKDSSRQPKQIKAMPTQQPSKRKIDSDEEDIFDLI